MKTRFKIFIISLIAIIMLVIGLIFAVNYKKESIKYFYDGGYVINNVYDDDTTNVDKIYFEENSSYIPHSNEQYSFTNSDGGRAIIGKDNFVHYTNGSIMALTDGVALDLSNINSNLLSYYNVFEGTVINKTTTGYEIDNLNDLISISKLMYKISDSKYLVAADKIVISFSDSQTVEMEEYAEIEYINENVIRIYNDKVNYQTIASNLYLIMDDITIDLEYKTISKNNVQYLTMANMVINADDNIEVLPKKPGATEEQEPNNNQEGNNGGNQNNENPSNNSIGTDINDQLNNLINNSGGTTEEPDDEPDFVQPTFKVDAMEVNNIGFENLKMSLEDTSNVLYGNQIVQIIENSTGKVIQTFDDWEEGKTEYSVNSYFSLKSDTEYTLTVVGQYKVEEDVYDRTFISKIFRTLDVGLELTQDYVTDSLVSFAIYKNSYSDVTGFTYQIFDKAGNEIVKDKLKYYDSNLLLVTSPDNLISNTEYTLKISEIQYGNDNFLTVSYESLQLSYKLKTLKEKPSKNVTLDYNVNSTNNVLTLSMSGVSDPNKGIKTYTYNVYNSLTNELVYTSVKDGYSNLELSISDDLQNGETYYFNVSMEFDDNEKTIIYVTDLSEVIKLSNISYPQLVEYVVDEELDDCESLKGALKISDPDNFIKINQIGEYRIVIKEKTNSNIDLQQYESSIEITGYQSDEQNIILPVNFEGLTPQTDYVLYVYLKYGGGYAYIGYENVSTLTPEGINLNVESVTMSSSNLFELNVNLLEGNSSNENLESIRFDLYGCSNNNVCTKLDYSRTIPVSQDSDELTNLKNGEVINVLSSEFDFYPVNYNSSYNYYKIMAFSYASNYEIPVVINQIDKNYVLTINDTIPYIYNFDVNKVVNEECTTSDFCTKNKDLDDDTAVGYKIEISTVPSTKNVPIDKVYYGIYPNQNDDTCSQVPGNLEYDNVNVGNNSAISFVPVDETNISRGTKYCIAYYGSYQNETEVTRNTETALKQIELLQKQPAKIKGYISEYSIFNTSINLNFDMNLNDPDSTVKNFVLKYDELSEKTINCSTNDCSSLVFEGLPNGGTYALYAVENLGEEDITSLIYSPNLSEIKTIELARIIIDPSLAGKIMFRVPYTNTCSEVEDNPISCFGNNLENMNIAGLIINNKYLDFKEKANGEYVAEMNLSDINEYGLSINDSMVSIENLEISLVYDKGSIGNNKFFIKAFNSSENQYYSKSLSAYSSISTSSIFSTSDIPSFSDNQYRLIDFGSTIGKNLENKSVILTNYASAPVELYDNNLVKMVDTFEINKTLSTSEIQNIQTSTGTVTNFSINSNSISGEPSFRIDLYENDGTSPIESEVISYDGSSWTNTKNASNTKISAINISNNDMEIIFDKFASYESNSTNTYAYTIYYSLDGNNWLPTYNNSTGVNNEKINISSIKSLLSNNKSATYETEYWHLLDSNINFNKTLNYTFDINTSVYQLKNTESIKYDIFLVNNTDSINIKSDISIQDAIANLSSNSSSIPLRSYVGTYNVVVRPYISNGTNTIVLEDIVLKNGLELTLNAPKISITNNGTVFNISMNDTDGVLTSYTKQLNLEGITSLTPLMSSSNNINVSDYTGDKVFYVKFYNMNDSLIAYSKVDFRFRTFALNLYDLFERNNLTSGYYNVVIDYFSLNSETATTSSYSKYVLYTGDLHLSLITLQKSYLLVMSNPNEESKDLIQKVAYQYTLSDGTTSELKEFSNIDLNTDNDINYTVITNSRNENSYYLEMPLNNNLSANISSLEIYFYDSGNNLITTYSK